MLPGPPAPWGPDHPLLKCHLYNNMIGVVVLVEAWWVQDMALCKNSPGFVPLLWLHRSNQCLSTLAQPHQHYSSTLFKWVSHKHIFSSFLWLSRSSFILLFVSENCRTVLNLDKQDILRMKVEGWTEDKEVGASGIDPLVRWLPWSLYFACTNSLFSLPPKGITPACVLC